MAGARCKRGVAPTPLATFAGSVRRLDRGVGDILPGDRPDGAAQVPGGAPGANDFVK
jgi:hypothetical protein